MIKIKNKPMLISILFLVAALILSTYVKSKSRENNADAAINTELSAQTVSANLKNHNNSEAEMVAVWVPFMSLNMKGTDYSEAAFKAKFDEIIKTALSHGINALIVHVRPFADALYPSKIYPHSHLLTGEQGKDPGFDALKYMIEATYQAGMQFHAWINPLRIQINGNPPSLCESSLYYTLKNDESNLEDIVMESGSDKFLNPGYEKARKIIIDGVREILTNYPEVDGVQFDDYFYPENDFECDKVCYQNYCGIPGNTQPLSQQEWRFANVNSLISGVYSAIKSINPDVVFGISPSGNLAHNAKIGADIATWCKTPGYIDYICPQIYFSLDHPTLPFETATKHFKDLQKHDKLKTYFGLALYKAGSETADSGTWQSHDDILQREYNLCKNLGCDGVMLYSIESFKDENAAREISNLTPCFKRLG